MTRGWAYFARVFRCTTFHIACLAALLSSSCQSPPAPLDLPLPELSVDYERSVVPTSGSPAVARTMELFAVSEAPAGTAIALAASAIISDRGTPFRGKTQLPTGCRWLGPADVRSWRDTVATAEPWQLQAMGSIASVIHHQLVTSVAVAANPKMPVLQFQVTDDGLRATLSIERSEADPDEDPGAGAEDSDEPVTEREVVVLAEPIDPTEPVALYVPDDRIPRGGLLLVASPQGTPDPDAMAAAQQVAEDKLANTADESPLPMAWRVAKKAVGERNRRPALLAVVTPLQRPRMTDLVLAADESLLIALTARLDRVAPAETGDGWAVEASMWRALVPRMERDDWTPSLRAAAMRHLGAIADDASTLLLLLKMADGDDAFAKGLLEENLGALADRSAAVRVTATRWLKERGVEVAGYDPMGNKADRRRAVRRYLAAREADREARRASEGAPPKSTTSKSTTAEAGR